MASKTAILSVRVVSDVKDATAGMDQVADKAGQMENGLKKAAIPAAAVVGALGLVAKAATDAASDLQQSVGAVEAVYGAHADTVTANAERAASSVGLAAAEYNNLAAVLGAQLTTMGTSADDLAGQTDQLISLGADLAATFGGTTADAVAAVSSLLRGERDPIEKYGVSIKQADIEARLAAQGLTGLTGEAAKTAEAQATLALLTEQTAAAQGQFARESDSAAGAQQIANAEWENAKASLGEKLLPVVTQFTQAMGTAATFVADHSTAVLIAAGVIGGLAATILAINGGLAAYHAIQTAVRVATTAWTAAQGALNVVMNLNPIGIVVTAIAALVAGIIYAYQNSETFRNGVNGLWEAIKSGASKVMTWIQPIIDGFWAMVDGVQSAYTWVSNLFSNFTPPAWLSQVGSFLGLSAGGAPPTIEAAAGAAASVPTLATLVRRRTSADTTPAPSVVNITVNGALDPVAVAEQIRRILTAAERRTGAVIIGAAR